MSDSLGQRQKTPVTPDLPRMAFASEVPPLNLSSGPAQIFRLLRQYPADRLLLCEDSGLPRYPGHELEGVARHRFWFNWNRLMRSRFGRWNGILTFVLDPLLLARRMASVLKASGTEAILSVAHGHVWWPAYCASRRLGLPFHLIVHDHWRCSMALPPWLDRRAAIRFGTAYRGAASRFVVSPAMARRYGSEYGKDAQVLYPIQHPDSKAHLDAPARNGNPFVFAYAGAMDGQWARKAVVDLAHAVDPLGARVRVYQDVGFGLLRAAGLLSDNVDIQPFLPALELHRRLREEADALFLPMSFEPADRGNVELCFPSKLTDYTVPALPLLVYAPPYGTAVEWAEQNPNTALVVDRQDLAILRSAAKALISSRDLRSRLGAATAAAGLRHFSAKKGFDAFADSVRKSAP
jgi:glycosyltransferase involved in cell wall biosynthesis